MTIIQLSIKLQFTSVAQLCPTLCDPMDCSSPGLLVHHQLPEPTQSHVHHVGDVIQPSHPQSSLLPLPSIFASKRVFSSESFLGIKWPKYWSFSFSISPSNEYSELISFRIDWLDLFAVQGTLAVQGISSGKNTGVVALPFSWGSSLPRDRTQVSLIVGRFFTI